MDGLYAAAAVVAGYLCGSIPFGLLAGRRLGVDVRQAGSGNIGATNVARTIGKKLGALVLLLDALKGALPLAAWILFDLGDRIELAPAFDPFLLTAVGLAPILGHCFPIWLRFRGGKGVATALGVFLVADAPVIGMAAALFGLVYLATRIVSLGSLTAAIAVPVIGAVLGRPAPILALGGAGAVVVVFKHRQNIARLLRRSELRV